MLKLLAPVGKVFQPDILMLIVDFYKKLSQKRCLSLDSEELRSKFQELSKKQHPDAGGHEEGFAQLNQAHQILSNPASRIGHLYELIFEDSLKSDGSLSPEVMDLFGEIGKIISSADLFIKKKSQTLSSIGEAMLSKELARVQSDLFEASGKVRSAKSKIIESFAEIDRLLDAEMGSAKLKMEISFRDISFLLKWEKEVMHRMQSII